MKQIHHKTNLKLLISVQSLIYFLLLSPKNNTEVHHNLAVRSKIEMMKRHSIKVDLDLYRGRITMNAEQPNARKLVLTSTEFEK